MPARNDAIALLKADHRKVEELFAKYETARGKKAEIAKRICLELTIHTMIEEEIFYPACRKAGVDAAMMDEANVEHDGAKVLIGELERGKGALPHAHPGIEQVCYLLEGEAHVEVGGEKFEMKAGEACFFPPDAMHVFIVTSEKARVLVVYAPPYLEKNARTLASP